MEWNVNKTAAQRERLRRRKATRNSVKNKPVRVVRLKPFQTDNGNGMSEDIPTSGNGWTLR